MNLQHDSQLDYHGKRLATCSSDRTVKVFDVVDGEPKSTGHTLKGFVGAACDLYDRLSSRSHTGPVWQVAWAHPKFGNILASCAYDGKVYIWKEQGATWSPIKEHSLHTASGTHSSSLQPAQCSRVLPVNSVSWAPHELGAIVACASSDGRLSVMTFKSTCHRRTRMTLPDALR